MHYMCQKSEVCTADQMLVHFSSAFHYNNLCSIIGTIVHIMKQMGKNFLISTQEKQENKIRKMWLSTAPRPRHRRRGLGGTPRRLAADACGGWTRRDVGGSRVRRPHRSHGLQRAVHGAHAMEIQIMDRGSSSRRRSEARRSSSVNRGWGGTTIGGGGVPGGVLVRGGGK
jgi:hypothetical protein